MGHMHLQGCDGSVFDACVYRTEAAPQQGKPHLPESIHWPKAPKLLLINTLTTVPLRLCTRWAYQGIKLSRIQTAYKAFSLSLPFSHEAACFFPSSCYAVTIHATLSPFFSLCSIACLAPVLATGA